MSIRKVLSPLLIISYVCGLRVIELPAGVTRQFSLLYMLLLWSLYNFIFIYELMPYTIHYSTLYHIWIGVNMFIGFSSIIIGIYHDKAFRNCIKNLTIVNDTLEQLGTITDYKLYMRTIWLILGWFMIAILIICEEVIAIRSENHIITQDICVSCIRIYCIHVNVIGDITITTMLGYVGLKYDQINEHLENVTKGNKRKLKQAWEHPVLLCQQIRYAKTLETSKNAYMIWIVMHLYSELRKISRQIDLVFGTQMTMEMGCYFAFIALSLHEIFNVIFIKNYHNNEKLYVIILLQWLFLHVSRLFLINYECEKISIKASVTGNLIGKLSHSNCDVEVRENTLQFLLMTQTPLKFYGLGLFQFGFKFLQGFITSVVTLLVILLQGYTNK